MKYSLPIISKILWKNAISLSYRLALTRDNQNTFCNFEKSFSSVKILKWRDWGPLWPFLSIPGTYYFWYRKCSVCLTRQFVQMTSFEHCFTFLDRQFECKRKVSYYSQSAVSLSIQNPLHLLRTEDANQSVSSAAQKMCQVAYIPLYAWIAWKAA